MNLFALENIHIIAWGGFLFLVKFSRKSCKFYFILAGNSDAVSAAHESGILAGRNSYNFCKCLQEIAVIAKAAQAARLCHRASFYQQDLRPGNALGRDIAVNCGAGGILKNLVQVGAAQVELGGQHGNAEVLREMLIDIVQYFVDFGMVIPERAVDLIFDRIRLLNTSGDKYTVQKRHQLEKHRLVQHILPKFALLRQFVYKIHEPLALFFGQADSVSQNWISIGKAVVQVGLFCGKPLQIVWVNRYHHTHMIRMINVR